MDKKVRILIIEDEYFIWRQLKKVLEELGYEVIGNGVDMDCIMEDVRTKQFDLAIVDINLNDKQKDGLWFGNYLYYHRHVPFIFLTAYESADIVKSAVETKPSAYLTKPFNAAELLAAIELAINQRIDSANSQHLIVKNEDVMIKIHIADIDIIESEGNYLNIFCNNHKYKYRGTIRAMLERLSHEHFVQTHRAYIVRKRCILKINEIGIFIENLFVPVASNFRNSVLEVFRSNTM